MIKDSWFRTVQTGKAGSRGFHQADQACRRLGSQRGDSQPGKWGFLSSPKLAPQTKFKETTFWPKTHKIRSLDLFFRAKRGFSVDFRLKMAWLADILTRPWAPFRGT